VRLDEQAQLALECIRLAGQAAKLRHLLARDPHARVSFHASQPAVDSIELTWRRQLARRERALELGTEGDEMPAQPVLSWSAPA
jgi:hypothetical protein